jgi:hypothetical protein
MVSLKESRTSVYNRLHNPDEYSADIARLRSLQVEMDQAVATAYGWQDLDLGHCFRTIEQGIRYTISEAARDEVLDRLLTLNHQRHAEEEAERLARYTPARVKRRGKRKPEPMALSRQPVMDFS